MDRHGPQCSGVERCAGSATTGRLRPVHLSRQHAALRPAARPSCRNTDAFLTESLGFRGIGRCVQCGVQQGLQTCLWGLPRSSEDIFQQMHDGVLQLSE